MATARKRPDVERALARPDPAVRCYLLYGPDDAGSRALAALLVTAVGDDAERIDLTPAQLRNDPALLADEAAAVSLFGGARHIRVDGAGDECLGAVEALFGASVAGNPVVLIGGALRKDSKLVKRIGEDPAGLAFASYVPEGGDLDRMATTIAREHGLRLQADVARRLAAAANGDRAVLTREVEKIALYLDAAPDRLRDADHGALDAIGADAGEADTGRLLEALFGGDTVALDRELSRATAEGLDGIPMLRAVVRRLQAMLAARTEMDRGADPKSAVDRGARQLFWREKDAVVRDLPRWPSVRLAAAIDRCADAERGLKSVRGAGGVAADQLLLAMARSVRR